MQEGSGAKVRTARISESRPDLVRSRSRSSSQRKVRARVVGILRMYEAHTDTEAGTLSGVIYVCDRDDVADAVRRAADDAWLRPPALSFRAMHDIVEETRTAAELHKAVAGS